MNKILYKNISGMFLFVFFYDEETSKMLILDLEGFQHFIDALNTFLILSKISISMFSSKKFLLTL